jgi:hypothetical protein
MAMRKINISYWTVTILFGGFMLFSAIPDIIMVPEAVEYVCHKLGYPPYFLPFIGVLKALGVIAILVPVLRWFVNGHTQDSFLIF